MKESTLPKKRYTATEAKSIRQVRDAYQSARNAMRNNCYWGDPNSGYAGDWFDRWDIQEKIAMGWSEAPSTDGFESNVKSPMSAGRIESTMHKLRKLDVQFVVRPDDIKDPKDKRKAKVVQELLNNLFQRREFKARLNEWFQDTLIHGTGFVHVQYLQKKRKVKMPKVDTKKMSKEEKEMVKNGERVFEEETVYDYDDIAIEPVKIQEIFIDPSGRNVAGTSYEAQWVIRRMLPSMQQFKAMFKNDPDAKNISKVRPISSYTNEDAEFFEPPTDIDDNDYVEVLHYYNKAKDKYVVVANDVEIKNMPLPYMHKQLPIVKIDAYKILHQMYGMGIPDRLKNIQSEEEILKNLIYDRLHITANPMLKVKRGVYGEFSKSYQTAEPGLMLPVSQMDDVSALEYPSMNFDMFRGIDALDRDAVLATQIDPIQMGVNQKYVSATTSMLTKEQMDTFITALIDNWTEALNMVAKQCISLMSQYYTIPRIEEAGKSARNRHVRLLDIEINPDTLEVVEKRNKYTYLEIKPDFFNINGDWDIEIAPESVEVQSRAMEMQKSQANLAQLAPFMVDPNNPQSVLANPTPWINGPKMIEWYMETNAIPHELIAVTNEDEDISMERAEAQGKKLLESERVPGIPGESEIHKKVHVGQMKIINAAKERLEKRFEQYPEEIMPYIMETEEGKKLGDLAEIAQLYAEHLMQDDQPAALENKVAVEGSMPPEPEQPQVPMPPGLNQGGAGQPPMPAGANQGGGEMPQGRPPMAEQGL